jgi:hypothetical protein
MKNHGQAFLEELASQPPDTFEGRFSTVSTKLGLGRDLGRNELQLLYQATLEAALCNLRINGLAGCGGKVRPEDEPNRTRLEREFMEARDMLFASPGWQTLTESEQVKLQKIFLSVLVTDDKLAP